jgi:tryptophanyl-tRNA synthetase
MTAMPSPDVRPRVLSGMQPTADSLHLGNYVGALRQWVALQATHEVFYFVADLHSLTLDTDPADRLRRTRITAAQFLAAGVDPQTSVLFVQSHLPQHAELAWVLGCITGYGEAGRMTQFKDKAARVGTGGTNVGLFTYPVLQAADILLYRPQLVPVGEDQRQHLELSRDLAVRFNHRFRDVFVVPEPYILSQTARIYDLQHPGDKMSGSVGGPGCLFLSDPPKVLEKKIRSAVTDTGREIVYDPQDKPGVSNLLSIAASMTGETIPALQERFAGAGYGELKKDVAAAVLDWVVPFQERLQSWLEDPARLDDVLARGAERAGETARAVLESVYDAVGLLPKGR